MTSNQICSCTTTAPPTRRLLRRAVRAALCVVTSVGLASCGDLLEVTDPTLVQDKDIATAAGANGRRLGAAWWFNYMAANLADHVAIFTDERMIDKPMFNTNLSPNDALDMRDSEGYESFFRAPNLGAWNTVFTKAGIAISAVRSYTPDSLKGDFLAQLFAIRGYAVVQIAEDICPGFPINEVSETNEPVYGGPLTTDSALTYALTQIDSALAQARDSTHFRNLASVLRGRALLDLGQYSPAATAVADVPTDFAYRIEGIEIGNIFYQQQFRWDAIGGCCNDQSAVGEREGGNGLPFVSAQDPRVGTQFQQVRYSDPADSLYDQTKYTSSSDPMVLASGVEARLIEAEAALNAGNSSWIDIVNNLRSEAISPSLPPLTAPATTDARVDLLYRERAFWLYLTGRRLGDLRRLVRNYNRDPETVYPTGQYPLSGGVYATATAIPFSLNAEQRYNHQITSGCTTR